MYEGFYYKRTPRRKSWEQSADDVIFSDDHPKSLFWAMDRQCIDELLKLLDLPKDARKAGEKMELLCSLLYIFLDVMPGASFEEIVAELIARDPKYAAEGMDSRIENAWKTIQKLDANSLI